MDEEKWRKRYRREKEARKQAEQIAEEKTREIFFRNRELTQLAESLEEKVAERTLELREKNESLQLSQAQLQEQQKILRETNEALKQKANELEEASRFKSEFLANISHELRTPLNSLMILSRLLVEGKNDNMTEDQTQSLQIIFNSANELLKLIEEILDMSKVETGELSIQKEDILLADIWHSIKDQYMPVAKERNILFSAELSSDLPKRIHTDRKRLKQILKNLLSNAFKFTPEKGEVILKVNRSTWSQGEFTSEGLLFEVEDTGIGIPVDKQEEVFQAFRQVDGSKKRKFGGTGLGLSISQQIANLLGGEIKLKSVEGQGSTFSVHLPPAVLVTDIPESAGNNENAFFVDSETRYEKMFNAEQVLLVDDDLRNSFALSRLLQGLGLQVHLSENGQSALEHLDAGNKVDLVLLDLQMPEMDGFQFVEAVRGRIEFSLLPVIILTASDSAEDQKKCRAAGTDDYLCKPVEISVLIDRLGNWLGN